MEEASSCISFTGSGEVLASKKCTKYIAKLQSLVARKTTSFHTNQPDIVFHNVSFASRGYQKLLPKIPKKKPWSMCPKTLRHESSGSAAWKSGKGCIGTNGVLAITPLDRLRTAGRRDRSLQFGMSPKVENSFEKNQSFPLCTKPKNVKAEYSAKHCEALNKFKGDELGSFSYSGIGLLPGKSLHSKTSESLNLLSRTCSLAESWSMNSLTTAGPLPSAVTTVYNPNKAVLTVDAKSFQILMVSDTACHLFNMCSEELCSRKLQELFVRFGHGPESLMETQLETSGQVVLVSGKVLEAVLSTGEILPVSLWMRKVESDIETRFIAVMEPVQRTTANVVFDDKGIILCSDASLTALLGYQNPSDIEGIDLRKVIPSLILPDSKAIEPLPKEIRKQCCTGRTRDGASFPLTIYLEPDVECYNPLTPSYSFCSVDSHTNSVLKNILQRKSYQGGSTNSSLVCEASATEEGSVGSFESGEWPSENVAAQDNLPNLCSDSDDPKSSIYTGIIWIFTNISGMITLLPDGTIHSCNHHFGLMLFGYSQNQLVGKNISYLIPSFYDDQEFLDSDFAAYPPYEEDELEDEISINQQLLSSVDVSNNLANRLHAQNISAIPVDIKDNSAQSNKITNGNNVFIANHIPVQTSQEKNMSIANAGADINGNPTSCSVLNGVVDLSTVCKDNNETSKNGKSVQNVEDNTDRESSSTLTHDSSSSAKGTPTEESSSLSDELPLPPPPPPIIMQRGHSETPEISKCYNTSTPSETPVKCKQNKRIFEGSYFGLGQHRDGSELAIVYQIRVIELDNGQSLYCVWVSRDPDEPTEGFRLTTSFDVTSSCNSSIDVSSSLLNSEQANNERKLLGDISSQSSVDYSTQDCTRGPYSSHYTTLEQIGKGAFGCVKLCYRNTDKLLVVTKFIRKTKVYKECWVDDSALQKVVPLEVSLLTILDHPNIVKVLDVYENEDFLQMVMEKHGCGMDLFEFIDRAPNMDEPLASYIFRQVVAAVSYLHSLNISHRDIKDENIILDEKFHIKLIDFGSATFLSPTRLFSTFCGTVEYCSPEVLSGEKYRGPELEMWSLGVTLYTLIFGENPFFDIDETIQAVLHPPFAVSKGLMNLISHLLHPDPNLRCNLRDLEQNEWLHQAVNIENYCFEEVVHCNSREANPPRVYSDLGYDK